MLSFERNQLAISKMLYLAALNCDEGNSLTGTGMPKDNLLFTVFDEVDELEKLAHPDDE
jgi:hypothetical protein